MAEYATLKQSAGVSFYAAARALTPVAFKPEDIHLGDYAFVPYVRTGLAAAIKDVPTGNRAVIQARVEVADSANPATSQPVGRVLTLYGPGDVTGIDPAQVIRREPAPDSADAERGYMAHIEFALPDFPWMFAPEPAAADTCKPWLALVVCEAALTHIEPSRGELPAQIWTKKGQLQPLEENHRFCHAQVVGAAIDPAGPRLRGDAADTVETRLSPEHGPANLSRILCPRRLDDATTYVAALVPAYDCGVRAGLGMGGGSLSAAWTRAPGDEQDDIVLPVYDFWSFRTAPGGSFRELAERIEGLPAPWAIGRRLIDLSRPGSGIPELPEGDSDAIQILKCALYSPATEPPGRPVTTAWPVAHRDAVRLRVDQANDSADPDLPRVGARLYARFQRAANRIGAVFGNPPGDAVAADADWFPQLNTDPMLRIVASLGAKVVRRDQEALMQSAWAQVEGIRRANQALVWAGMAEVVNISIRDRHIAVLDAGSLMQVTRNLHPRLRDSGHDRTVLAAVTNSRTAATVMTGAFRRALRQGGSIGQKLAVAVDGKIVAGPTGFADHRRAYRTPDGILAVSKAGMAFFPAEIVARRLGVPVDAALARLDQRIGVLAEGGGALRQLATTKWRGPDGMAGEALAGALLEQLGERVDRFEAGHASGAEGLAELLVGIGNSGLAVSGRAKSVLDKVDRVVPRVDLPGRIVTGPIVTGPIVTGPIVTGPIITGPVITRPVTPLPGTRPMTPVAPTPFGRTIPERGATITGPLSRSNTVTGGRIGAGPVLTNRPADSLLRIPTEPQARFETDMSRWVSAQFAELNRMPLQTLRDQLAVMVRDQVAPAVMQTDLGPLAVSKPTILAQIDPRVTARAAFRGRLAVSGHAIPANWIDLLGLRPIMAAPEIRRPMSNALEDFDRDWLVPGLGTIAARDFITLLAINPGFAEAFLIGASDEMGRELLWRDYPTDQRGTYFKRFWDADEDELTGPIHRFSRQPIGSHFSIGGDKAAGAGALALVVRGELLRRFPDTFIMAIRAISDAVPPTFAAGTEARVLFHSHLKPDYNIIGFDLTPEQLGPQNWWFVLAQNPTAPRFGLDGNPSASTAHDNLDWADFGNIPVGGFLGTGRSFDVHDANGKPDTVRWPGHAGVVARILLNNPIRAAWRADTLIDTSGTTRDAGRR
ncbi:hypothetical protein [Paracoccus laeviglucosivorans]|uniref:Uncharacterized protein n=1 Tax=Paracoccus laeviglucosivorans TaxID=1197861 RepID=A0A521E1T8_9RHOB|nr:hypothetical protein [Paracoccus laeviglucosivorans]SMO77080.1 hypothetical protein SAMN06265221_110119 [Paracoccus laeviglucosivorans]